MMILVYVYLALFTLIVIVVCASSFFGRSDDDTPMLEHVLDFVAALILWLGMVMFVIDVRHTVLQYTWIVLAVCSAIYVVASSWRGRRKELSDPESEASKSAVAFADVAVCFMLFPALLINVLFGVSSS